MFVNIRCRMQSIYKFHLQILYRTFRHANHRFDPLTATSDLGVAKRPAHLQIHQFCSFSFCLCFSSSRCRSPCHLVLSCCWVSLSHLSETVRCVAGTEESLLSSLPRLPSFASEVGLAHSLVLCQDRDESFSSLTR